MITLTTMKRKHLTQKGQSTTPSKVPQALHMAVKDHMRTQATRRTTTQSQRTTTNLNMRAKKNLSLTAITGQTKIINQSVHMMKMNMPKITQAAVDQEQVSQGTHQAVDTGTHGIQPRIPAALPRRMEIQLGASTTVPTTIMEVQPEAKKRQGQIMEVRQTTTAVACKTMAAHMIIMSMAQVRRVFTRTHRNMPAQTTKIQGIIGIPMKTTEAGTKTTTEAPAMTPEAQDFSTLSLGKSTVRVAPTIWMATVGLIHAQVKSMGGQVKVTSTTSTNMMNSMMTIQEATTKTIQNPSTTMSMEAMRFPTTKMNPGQVMIDQRATEHHRSSSQN